MVREVWEEKAAEFSDKLKVLCVINLQWRHRGAVRLMAGERMTLALAHGSEDVADLRTNDH